MANNKRINLNPPIITVGAFIRKAREEQGMKQEDLCHDICTVSNLSRIENGVQMPTPIRLEAFLQRLGFSPDLFPSFLNERELKIYQLRHEINIKFDEEKFAEVEVLLDKMEKKFDREQINSIFITFIKIMLLWKESSITKDVLIKLENLVRIFRLNEYQG